MKNRLKIQPGEWKREREIGQVSFIIKRAITFAIFAIPLVLISNFLFLPENENFEFGAHIFTGITVSVVMSVIEWLSLEHEYRKNRRKEDSGKLKNNTEKEKRIFN